MLELILECGSWLHRSCQFHEVVMKRRSHSLELALESSHRFEAVSQVLQMAGHSRDAVREAMASDALGLPK